MILIKNKEFLIVSHGKKKIKNNDIVTQVLNKLSTKIY